jgi:large subunit ribosomal protein LP2
MRYVAAYLLAQLGGNAAPDADAIKAILASVGVDADSERLNKVISELSGKNIEEVLAEGREKLASVPSGGAAPAAAAGGAAAAAEEAPKEAVKEESESEEDDDMGFGLFD